MREELLKIAKPILFNTEMVKAILEGRKTVTRRVIPEKMVDEYYDYDDFCISVGTSDIPTTREYEEEFFSKRAKYQVGDILYVRETWQNGSFLEDNKGKAVDYIYKADDTKEYNSYSDWGIKWRPSIHMPKEAARIFLKVTDVKVERLQDMTSEDTYKEGVSKSSDEWNDWLNMITLWDSTTKEEQYKWKSNPYVWVIEFEKVIV